jgi:glycosyltransferase involved in cell wall biosynthesis
MPSVSRGGLRRPVFIYLANLVGGTEYMYLRRAESARRLGLDPVIITVPGPMDESYLQAAKVIHLAPKVFGKFAFTHGKAQEMADEIARLLGSRPCHVEATGMPAFYFGALIAERIPGSECLFHLTAPRTTPLRRPPAWKDLWQAPHRFWRGLRGRLPYVEFKELADSGRLLSVNQECADTSAAQLGLATFSAKITPLSVGMVAPEAAVAKEAFVLSVGRLDGKMKAYVEGLIRSWPAILRAHPSMKLRIVGDGPAKDAYLALADAEGVGKSVEFLGTVDNRALSALYGAAQVFVGMGTAAIEAAMHGTPVIIAVEGQKSCLTPGCFGDPAVKGFGESLPGQILTPAADLLAELLADPERNAAIAERGRLFAMATHHPDACDRRLTDLLSATYGPPVPLPAPLVRLRQVLVNFLSARLFRRPYATWAVRA